MLLEMESLSLAIIGVKMKGNGEVFWLGESDICEEECCGSGKLDERVLNYMNSGTT